MTIYIINFISIFFYLFLYRICSRLFEKKNNRTRIKIFFCLIIIIQLILILGLRDKNLGRDLVNYRPFFEQCIKYRTKIFKFSRFETGYIWLNIIIGNISRDFNVFLFVVAMLSLIPIGYIICKYSKNVFLSFIIYLAFDFYSFLFSGLRQGISFGIVFFSYKYIREKKPIRFIVCVIIASLFHKSAIVFLPAYILSKININKKVIINYFIIMCITFIFRTSIMRFFIEFFYDNYSVVTSDSYTYLLCSIVILIFGIVFYKQVLKENKLASSYYIFIMVGILFLVFTSVGTNMLRISNYYYMFIILFIPEVLSKINDKMLSFIMSYFIVILLLLLFLKYLNGNCFDQVPYISLFTK